MAGWILINRDEAGDAAALLENFAHAMAWGLGRNHRDVDVLRRNDPTEANIKAVGEHQHLARREVRRNRFAVEAGLDMIRHQHHDDVSPLRSGLHRANGQTGFFGLSHRLAFERKAHAHLHPTLF